jgi:hypothetical protein
MKRMSVRRERKNHGARRAILAVGALGAAAGGLRRWRHRHQPERPET